MSTTESPTRRNDQPLTATEWIVSDLHRRIDRGEFSKSLKLPSRRELASHYTVSPATVTNAMRRLRERGLVRNLDGRGIFLVQPGAQRAEGIERRSTGGSRSPDLVAVWGGYLPPSDRLAAEGGARAGREPILDGIWAAAGERGCQLLLAPPAGEDRFDPQAIQDRGVDGLILAGGHPPDWSVLNGLSCPAVTCNYLPDRTPIASVDYDHEWMVRDMVRRFAEAGHGRIGFVTVELQLPSLLDRLRAMFFSALIEHGLVYDARPYWHCVGPSIYRRDRKPSDAPERQIERLRERWSSLEEPPTAVFMFQRELKWIVESAVRPLVDPIDFMSVFNEPGGAFCPGYLNPHFELGKRLMDMLETQLREPRLVRHERLKQQFISSSPSGNASTARSPGGAVVHGE